MFLNTEGGYSTLDGPQASHLFDKGVTALAASCTALRSLNLHGCKEVTDEGVTALAASCTNLRWLNLRDCTEVTGGGLQALAAAVPGCTVRAPTQAPHMII